MNIWILLGLLAALFIVAVAWMVLATMNCPMEGPAVPGWYCWPA